MNNLLMNAPTEFRRYPRDMVPQESQIRVFGHDPESLTVQIRGPKSFALVYLNADEATALIEALKDARDRIS